MKPTPAPKTLQLKFSELITQTSVLAVARRFNIAEATVARVAGGLPVQPGTILVLEDLVSKLGNVR